MDYYIFIGMILLAGIIFAVVKITQKENYVDSLQILNPSKLYNFAKESDENMKQVIFLFDNYLQKKLENDNLYKDFLIQQADTAIQKADKQIFDKFIRGQIGLDDKILMALEFMYYQIYELQISGKNQKDLDYYQKLRQRLLDGLSDNNDIEINKAIKEIEAIESLESKSGEVTGHPPVTDTVATAGAPQKLKPKVKSGSVAIGKGTSTKSRTM